MAFTSLLLHDYYTLPCWCTCTIIIHSHVFIMCCILHILQVQNETLQVHESHTKGSLLGDASKKMCAYMFLLSISTSLEKRKAQQSFRVWNINVTIHLPALHQSSIPRSSKSPTQAFDEATRAETCFLYLHKH